MTSFAARLLEWFDRERRDLPWRRTADPWAIWVSEVMLQQTRVDVVVPAFERFVAKFPTAADFASASDAELLEAWRGLGYYRRARLLRAGAQAVVAEHHGRIPPHPRELGALAGVGDYTRGAIASIAFGLPVPAIDGNVERVLARHAAVRDNVKRSPGRQRIAELALARMDTARAGDFNQALMELGALVCKPRTPDCGRCPVASDCEARRLGLTAALPVVPKRRAAVEVHSRAVLCARPGGRFLAMRVPSGEINEGQLTLPGPGILVDCPDPAVLADELLERFSARLWVGPEVTTVRHGITHHRIRWTIHTATLHGRRPAALCDASPRDVSTPWTTAARKALGAVDAPSETAE